MNSLIGKVAFGVNNIFTVTSGGQRYLCRIKGKILRGEEPAYNPLAPGDEVEFIVDAHTEHEGLILRLLPRKNALVRWNRKRQARQIIAANIDLLVCIGSVGNPPFRPRFIDRVLIGASDIPTLIAINKADLGTPQTIIDRVKDYERIGYPTLFCSAVDGRGLDELEKRVTRRACVYFGQSGVGKSSLINRIYPGLRMEVGGISQKYDRGRHTTKNARLVEHERGAVIDTPGIRHIDSVLENPEGLDSLFPEFQKYMQDCAFQPCSHLHEPGCAVQQAVKEGGIHPDRYESYVRIYQELEAKKNTYA